VSKEKPGIVGRIGMMLYGIGCGLGILSVPVAVWSFFDIGIEYDLDVIASGPGLALGFGFCAWLVGRLARFLLNGD
jgi:hypothetical protein